jgi:type IV secretory pathway TrbF-like protein
MTEMDQRCSTPQMSAAELRDEVGAFLQRIEAVTLEAGMHRDMPMSARELLARHLDRAQAALRDAAVTVAPWPRLAVVKP